MTTPRIIDIHTPIAQAVQRLYDATTTAVLTTKTDPKNNIAYVQGILTEKDYMTKLHHGSYAPTDITTEQIMTKQLDIATLETKVLYSLSILVQHGRRHLPVLTKEGFDALSQGNKALSSSLSLLLTSSTPLPVSYLYLLTMKELIGYLIEQIYNEQIMNGKPTEELKQGISIPSLSSTETSSKITNTTSNTHSTPSSPSTSSPNSLTINNNTVIPLQWYHRTGDVLLALKALNRKPILLNTHIQDKVTVADAANIMAEKNMSALAIIDNKQRMAGMFTSRDFLNRVVSKGNNATLLPVQDVMTKDIISASPDASVLRVARAMVKRGVRHIPISEADGTVLGILSLSDIARVLTGQLLYPLQQSTPTLDTKISNNIGIQ